MSPTRKTKKLTLNKETLRTVVGAELDRVRGANVDAPGTRGTAYRCGTLISCFATCDTCMATCITCFACILTG